MVKQGKLFIVSAPSGAGKTSLVTAIIDRLSPKYPMERVITYTTKQPRIGEIHGRDYYFISIADFKEKVAQGFFIEWSASYGHYYGSPRDICTIVNRGTSLLLVIDRAGAQQVYLQLQDAILIWLYTKNIEVLKERLQGRATENDKEVQFRLQLAQDEINAEEEMPLYHHHILNDNFENALCELELVMIGSLK